VGKAEFERILKIAKQSKEDLINVGYPEFAVEDFHEVYKLGTINSKILNWDSN
jgi:hypothetical protein